MTKQYTLEEIKADKQALADRGVDPDIVATCYHNHLVNELGRRLTKARLNKLTDEKLEELLTVLDTQQ